MQYTFYNVLIYMAENLHLPDNNYHYVITQRKP